MSLNFNVSPYYDDFDPAKNFYRILFKPGYAVQARELTQSQSITQNQIVNFASAIFAQNTPISGGKVSVNVNCYYIKLLATTPLGVSSDSIISQFLGQTIQDQTGTIVATVVAAIPSTGVGGDPTTLIVSYLSGQHFSNGAVLFNTSNNNLQVQAIASNATGSSSVASISQGVFWVSSNYTNKSGEVIQNGAFVQVNPQTIVLDKYDNSPSLRIGLNITENIVSYNYDPSLLDPAVGASNYQAPGADRYQILLTLVTLPITLGNDQNFIELTRVVNGQIVYTNNTTQYSSIDDYLAKRTYETNGDFIVDNFGLNPVSNTATPNGHNGYTQYDLQIGKGVAYVHGYRIENQSTLVLTNDRAQTTTTQNNNYNYIDYGQYFYVDTVGGLFDVSTSPKVDVHIVGAGSIITSNANTYNSTLVGTGYITDLVYDHDTTDANTSSYVFKAYVHDIVTNSLTGNATSANATTIVFPNNGIFSTVANAYYGVTLTIIAGPSIGDSRTIVSYNAQTLTATVNSPFTTTPTANSTFALQFGTKDVDSIVIANSSTYAISANANINIEGKLGGIITNGTFYENPDVPELIYNLGYPYVASISGTSYSSRQVFRRKQFTGTPAALQITIPVGSQGVVGFEGGPGTLSADAIKQNYTAIITNSSNTANTGAINSILDLADTANLSVVISGTNNSVLTISDLTGKYTGAGLTVSIISKVNILNADNTQHVLKTKTLVTGNTTANAAVTGTAVTGVANVYYDLTNAQVYIKNSALVGVSNTQSLYVTDVKSIVKVVDSLSRSANVTTSMMTDPAYDLTSSFVLDNGQRDSIYSHAGIILKPGAPNPKGNILVVFNYYSHTSQLADGYFSYQSYVNETYSQIPSYLSNRGTVYNLRDCIDFRPCRVNGTSAYALEYTGNPSSDDTGTYIPQDLTNFISNYSYYLSRCDRLVLSKDKNFQIIQGKPALNPELPTEPDGSLILVNLYHDPYTTYLPSEAPAGILPNLSIENVRHRRWTMQDISDLEKRFDNFVDALNPSEQTAMNFLIPDSRGIPRIKNAVVVDDFTSYGVADTSNPYFSASIDTLKNSFSASHNVYNFKLQANTAINSLNQMDANTAAELGYVVNNVSKVSRYYSLPYTSTAAITQTLASRTLNLNPFAIQVYKGVGSLYPPMDNWIDGTIAPDLLLANINNLVANTSNTGLNATNVNNYQSIPGTQLPTGTSNTTSLVSSYVLNNGYVRNNTLQPYIRPQELIFRAKNMKINTPISCYFDGVNVNNYITNPNIIELKNSVGQFQEDDVIGITSNNTFYPIAVVAYTYNYPNSNNVRLYVTSDFSTNYSALNNSDYITDIISNAKFDANGNYLSNTAYAQLINTQIITTVNNGYISGVGGSFTDLSSNTIAGIYSTSSAGYGSFAQNYGVWNSAKPGTPSTFDVTFPLTITANGTYYFAAEGDDEVVVYLNGNLIINKTNASGSLGYYSTNLTANNYTVRIVNTQGDNDAFVACAISTTAWTNQTTTGQIVWSTRAPYHAILPNNITGIATVSSILGGGNYYTGVTNIILHPLTSNTVNLNAQTITITTPTFGINGTQGASITTTSNITSYNVSTKVATINPSVSIAIGQNQTYGLIDSTYSITGTANNYILAQIDGGPSPLATNENGAFCGIFNVPPAAFTTGVKTFRADNRTTATDPTTATTYAEATFYGSSISNAQNGNYNFSPSVVSDSQVIIATATAPTTTVAQSPTTTLYDPIAQTFSVDPKTYPNGMFLYSMQFFFNTKAVLTQSPVQLSIVGTSNDGTPNGQTLDNSIVVLNPDKINVSNTPYYADSNTMTEFVFPAPVYIQPGVTYAAILQSQSTEYNVWIASQNDIALQSSVGANTETVTKITSVPYAGQLYETQNGQQWTGDSTKALMFVLNRCFFDTSKHPKIPFIVASNLPQTTTVQNDVRNYYNNQTTNLQYEIDALNVTTTDYIPTNTNITYSYQGLLASGQLSTEVSVVPGRLGAPNYYDENLGDGQGPRYLQANNANSFVVYATLNSTDNRMTPIIADNALTLFTVQKNINNLPLNNTNINILYGGSGYNANTTQANVSAPDISGGIQATANVVIANGVVQGIYVTNSSSGYLNPPTITIYDANTGAPGTGAIISTTTELSPTEGNAGVRYVSKTISLSNINSSGDLRVYLTAYRPNNTNIFVFARVQNLNDSQRFTDGPWQLLTYINNSYGFSENTKDYLQLQLAPGINGVANNQISYLSTSTGLTYSSFNQFAFKVVLTSSDSTSIPEVTNLSVVALPAGN